jgi:hypothetical protein
VAEIDGAQKNSSSQSQNDDHALTEVKAHVVSVSASVVEVSPLKMEGPTGGWVSGPLRVDVSKAYFERTALSCLLPGKSLELKGSFDTAGVLIASKVEGEGACAAASPLAGVKLSDDSTVPPASGVVFVEVKGGITSLKAGEFVLNVFKVEGATIASGSVVVRHGMNTVFRGLDLNSLAVGVFVEVKGLYAAGVVDAAKIERD